MIISGKQAALVAAILASIGGGAFLAHHKEPSIKDVFLACEQGKLSGFVCCEDFNRVDDIQSPLASCGMVTPTNHDPFGNRKKLESDWDNLK